jgi:hypothetical protein
MTIKIKLSLTDERGLEVAICEDIAYTSTVGLDLTPGHPFRELVESRLPNLVDRLAVASGQVRDVMQAEADKIVSEGNYARPEAP